MMIKSAKVIRDYVMLIEFTDGKQVIYDFGKFEGERWFEAIKPHFQDYYITDGMLLWGDWVGIDPSQINEDGKDVTGIDATDDDALFLESMFPESPITRKDYFTHRYKTIPGTYEDYQNVDDEFTVEYENGRIRLLYSQTGVHSATLINLLVLLRPYFRDEHGGYMLTRFAVDLFGDQSYLRVPDLFGTFKEITWKGDDTYLPIVPEFMVEVVGENTITHDYVTKRDEYRKAGVQEYWIVNPIDTSVTVINFGDIDTVALVEEPQDEVPTKLLKDLHLLLKDIFEED